MYLYTYTQKNSFLFCLFHGLLKYMINLEKKENDYINHDK